MWVDLAEIYNSGDSNPSANVILSANGYSGGVFECSCFNRHKSGWYLTLIKVDLRHPVAGTIDIFVMDFNLPGP